MGTGAASQIIRCPNCGANNRVSSDRLADKKAVCGRCKEPLADAPAKPVIVTNANFIEIIGQSSQPVLLDFWASWCGPCRMIAPIIDRLAAELSGKVLVGKIDADANQRTAAALKVQSLPTLVIFQNAEEVDRIVGAVSKEAILQKLKKFM